MGSRRPPPMDFQSQMMPLTKAVKALIMINVAIWFIGVVIIEGYFLSEPYLSSTLALVPAKVFSSGFIWQIFTYLFIHPANPMPVIFNMLLLYFMGGQLERLWGTKFFVTYYLVAGIGSALLYCLTVLIYASLTGNATPLIYPVFGASAALFGLLIAYGIYYGEQVVYFMFFFPMKAKVFVALLGAIEVVLVLNNGPVQGKVSNLAHIYGIAAGFIFLKIWPRMGGGRSKVGRDQKKTKASKLRLIVNNDEHDEKSELKPGSKDDPKYWN